MSPVKPFCVLYACVALHLSLLANCNTYNIYNTYNIDNFHKTDDTYNTYNAPCQKHDGYHALMRKLVVLTFISLDGVMQAPGGKGEDPTGNFDLEGWTVPYFDEVVGEEMGKQMSPPLDLLLGRKTYEIFAAYWPNQRDDTAALLNKSMSFRDGSVNLDWAGSVQVKGDVVSEIKKLKAQDGPMLQVHGSSDLIQTLLANYLVDELWLKIFPVTLGKGKRLFGEGITLAAFKLTGSKASPSGVIIASYIRDGAVKLGSF